MQIGERIKYVREFRKITQKALGVALGYPEKSAAIRISQYESCSVLPKKDTIIEISKLLNCNSINFLRGQELGPAERFMIDLFWLEEVSGNSMYIFQLNRYSDESDSRIVHGHVNDYRYSSIFPPTAIAFNYNLVNDFMQEWATRFQELTLKEITREEYFEWKINWPRTCDDGGRFEPSIRWRKAK